MRIQTLCELGLGYRRIFSKFPDKQLNLQSVKNICRSVDQRGFCHFESKHLLENVVIN